MLPIGVSPEVAESMQATAEYGPLCEAMFLMMSADGAVDAEERDVLRGALRNLSGDALRTAQIDAMLDAMLDAASKRASEEGRARRMQDVIDELHEDRARAEVAFVLAAAIAFADNAIADQENDVLNALADGLGIDEARANELLDSVEQDLRTVAS